MKRSVLPVLVLLAIGATGCRRGASPAPSAAETRAEGPVAADVRTKAAPTSSAVPIPAAPSAEPNAAFASSSGTPGPAGAPEPGDGNSGEGPALAGGVAEEEAIEEAEAAREEDEEDGDGDEEDDDGDEDEDADFAGDPPQSAGAGEDRPSRGTLAPIRLKGTDEEKISTIRRLSARSRRRASEAGGSASAPRAAAEAGADDVVEGDDFRNDVNTMTAALDDDSPDVRDAAFEALLELPDAEREVLSLQIIGGDDPVLKDQLLDTAAAGTDEFSVTLLMQALDDEDAAVRGKAAGRLRTFFSVDFPSTEAAMEWWESQSHRFTFGENGPEPLPEDEDDRPHTQTP